MGGGLSLLRVLWLVWAKEYSSLFSELQAAVAQPCLVGLCCSRRCDRPQEQVGSCVQGAQQLSTPCPCPYQDGSSSVVFPSVPHPDGSLSCQSSDPKVLPPRSRPMVALWPWSLASRAFPVLAGQQAGLGGTGFLLPQPGSESLSSFPVWAALNLSPHSGALFMKSLIQFEFITASLDMTAWQTNSLSVPQGSRQCFPHPPLFYRDLTSQDLGL